MLDNCEHLIDAAARLADRLLAAAPGRADPGHQPRAARHHRRVAVPGALRCRCRRRTPTPRRARSPRAVRLFADRAAAVRPGFPLDADTVEPVVRICRALDGIPLAIELAAARLRALTAAQVADRLDDRFRLLTVGSRTALPRHQTLRAIVDWSWDLLDDAERRVLGGSRCSPAAPRRRRPSRSCGDDVIDVIASLVDKSLVIATGDTEVRYRLLETVRAYAAERLAEAGEEKRLKDAHAALLPRARRARGAGAAASRPAVLDRRG